MDTEEVLITIIYGDVVRKVYLEDLDARDYMCVLVCMSEVKFERERVKC